METKNIICFGFGQVAKNFIKKLNDKGVPFKLATTSREESKNKKFEYPRIISHLGFGLLVFCIGINHQFSLEIDFNLKVGETKKANYY